MEKNNSKASSEKAKLVKKLAEQIKNSSTLMIVSIKNLPSKQFQDIKKSIRDQAEVKVAKKNILLRAIKEVDKESILPLEEYIKENSAFVLSNVEGYELASDLFRKKNPVFAKAGQIATEDIEVKPGPTNLVPGPAISELGALGIQIAVEEGKISIKVPRVVVNKGGIINEGAASVLQKLNIQPFSVGLEPLAIYDVQSEKIYTNIKIDPNEAKEKLKEAASKALGFAQKIVYYCKETIGYFLAKANAEGEALNKLQPKEEATNPEPVEENKTEDTEEKKENNDQLNQAEEKA